MRRFTLSSAIIIATVLPESLTAGSFFPNSHSGIERTGDILQLAIPLSALLYSTAIGDWQGDKQWAYAVGSTWVTTEVLKYAIGEERPNQPEGAKGKTFPSGHTSFAFSGAAYWQRRYGWYIGAPMYGAAAFVAYSRVYAEKHNWLDVATGAAMGIAFNYLFTTRYENENIHLSFSPIQGGGYLNFNIKF